MPVHRKLAMTLAGALCAAAATAQNIKSFPQAEGFGAEATGGRGGVVYHVTSLGDSNTPGTLRYGIESLNPSVPVTIVFDVGGWINLNENLGVVRSNVTIAGQTAPGDGIGVRNRKFSIGGDDIVVRHVHFAYGRTAAASNDTVNVNNNSTDVIFDHVAAVMSRDEAFSAQSTNLTLQWSTISYGLQTHSAGSLLEQPTNLSFHHNLWAHNHTRNPKARVQGAFDYINNVVYDYDIGFIAGDSGTTDYFWPNNFDGNVFITGPNDSGNDMIRDGHAENTGLYFGTNYYDGDGDAVHDPEVYTGSSRNLGNVVSGSYTRVTTPYPVADPIWQEATPELAYQRVLAEFGPNPTNRNDLNALLASNVADRTGYQISNQSQLPISGDGWGDILGGAAPTDTDRDGMPDAWEAKHGLSTTVANNNGDFDADGFTDLEEYLNDLAAFAATGPLEFSGNGRYAEWGNWTRRWEPSRVDDVRIETGVATVDAVGQRAGDLRIGGDPGSNGGLAVTDGWIEVTDDLTVGGAGVGGVEQTGGVVRVLNGGVAIETGQYRLAGGVLQAPELSKGPGGVFLLEGGELQVGEVGFDLLNEGGVIAPGAGIGETHVSGDLTLSTGVVRIEVASPTEADLLSVDGVAVLGGTLEVQFVDGFAPTAGEWRIINASSFAGQFDALPNGFTLRESGADMLLVLGASLSGDYNGDGLVDAADYTVWRDGFGLSVTPGSGADGNGDGEVNQVDYHVWRSHYGESLGAAQPTPEPTGIAAATVAFVSSLGLKFREQRR
ncbi:hypothetical protein Pla108_17060 [Botrimarina colliarenosi]|uniref:Probable pectate lyase C n=1 Tax=Botrimarina colliarenosi TaxID=2528001 RepID=A0A5C6AC06_9BACT|nr:dockerin type I domain-containing protein [Botrimarina colliarenosi]TWT97554.1 hypothetical protein Pla108_17060 [Botrimarina colliarenosi]